MNGRTSNPQVINVENQPYVLIHLEEYEALKQARKSKLSEVAIPLDVLIIAADDNCNMLTAWRRYRQLTQGELANKADISQSALSQLEQGKTQPQKNTLKRLCKVLDIPTKYITDYEE